MGRARGSLLRARLPARGGQKQPSSPGGEIERFPAGGVLKRLLLLRGDADAEELLLALPLGLPSLRGTRHRSQRYHSGIRCVNGDLLDYVPRCSYSVPHEEARMNVVSFETRVRIVASLVEGNSIRSTQ